MVWTLASFPSFLFFLRVNGGGCSPPPPNP